jgi:hypothetical protein
MGFSMNSLKSSVRNWQTKLRILLVSSTIFAKTYEGRSGKAASLAPKNIVARPILPVALAGKM